MVFVSSRLLFGLLPHLIGCLGDDLVVRTDVGFQFISFVSVDPIKEQNVADTRDCYDAVSTLQYGVSQFRAETLVPRAPERRLIREQLESEILAERRIRLQVVVEGSLVPAVELPNQERPNQ